MKQLFKESSYINLTLRERNSIFLLMLLVGISMLAYISSFYFPSKVDLVISNTLDSLDLRDSEIIISNDSSLTSDELFSKHAFDPNDITLEQLKMHGLSAKIASNWVKYIEKGGRFKSVKDLSKIYGLTENMINNLMPYVIFETQPSKKSLDNRKIEPKSIDPNLANFRDFLSLGMSGQLANTLIKFRNGGAIFNNLNDLKKVHGMHDTILNEISGYFKFPDLISKIENNEPKISISVSKPFNKININTADTAELKYLPGIGSKLALRIVKYRNSLGGFYHTSQLKEIFGLTDSTYNKVLSKIVAEGELKQIKINIDDLTKIYHPYMDKKQASVIQNFINQHKPITTLEELKKIEIFDQAFWTKIEPYLDFTIH